MLQNITPLVLAAGKGKRMRSSTPKALVPLLGEPMLWYVYKALQEALLGKVFTVVGHGQEALEAAFPEEKAGFIVQEELLGTGHALMTAWDKLQAEKNEYVLVLNADAPLICKDILQKFCMECLHKKIDLAFMTVLLENPGSYGRVVRKEDSRVSIVEAKDWDEDFLGEPSGEINVGLYFLRLEAIKPLLSKLSKENKGEEYYITDLVGLATDAGLKVLAIEGGCNEQLLGINTPAELAVCEEKLRANIVDFWLQEDVLIRFPDSVIIGPRVKLEAGAEITGPSSLLGGTYVEGGAKISGHVYIEDSHIASLAWIREFSHLQGARVRVSCQVGPLARLRPGTVLETKSKVGNFVEIKKSTIGAGSKCSHLSYIGDAQVGEEVNIGAGTITCNYDGKSKHETQIDSGSFIGSNTALVAPVRVGRNSYVGAGSVITKEVPDDMLGVSRGRQVNIRRRRGLS